MRSVTAPAVPVRAAHLSTASAVSKVWSCRPDGALDRARRTSIKKMIYARIVMSLAPPAMVRQSTTVSNARATNFYLVASV